MGMDGKKKIGIASIAALLLVAMVVGVALTYQHNDTEGGPNPASSTGTLGSSQKAVQALCSTTDHEKICDESLANANTTDPKELIKLAFNYTVKTISIALQNSTLLQEAAKDPMTKDAFVVCQTVLEDSIDDLKRSFEKVDQFKATDIDEYVNDVKTWLSGSYTNQDTCIDAFENTTGDTGEKMKKLLEPAGELTSNALAMISNFSSVLSAFKMGGFGSRRLLTEESEAGRLLFEMSPYDYSPSGNKFLDSSDESRKLKEENVVIPSFVDSKARKLMAASPALVKPNVVVAKDGSGNFKTISAAIDTIPLKSNKTFVVYIKAGVYKETVIIPKKMNNVVLMGDGPGKTIISGNKCYADGVQTFHTATLAVNADGFMAKNMSIENTAGARGHQAVAARISSDKAVLYNVHLNGYQDTLYAHNYRQYYRDCHISGTIDFIFGNALAVFQSCRLIVRKPDVDQSCMVTAQGRKDRRSVGATIIQKSAIVATPEFLNTKPAIDAYLGRPWKEFSRTIIMFTTIEPFINPQGWSPWMGDFALDTCYYGEYKNTGKGATTKDRVKWKGIKTITEAIAKSFTPGVVYAGDKWVKDAAGVPYDPSF